MWTQLTGRRKMFSRKRFRLSECQFHVTHRPHLPYRRSYEARSLRFLRNRNFRKPGGFRIGTDSASHRNNDHKRRKSKLGSFSNLKVFASVRTIWRKWTDSKSGWKHFLVSVIKGMSPGKYMLNLWASKSTLKSFKDGCKILTGKLAKKNTKEPITLENTCIQLVVKKMEIKAPVSRHNIPQRTVIIRDLR